MGIFSFLKKKKEELPMPPPPSPPDIKPILKGDIEPIRAPGGPPEPMPAFTAPESLAPPMAPMPTEPFHPPLDMPAPPPPVEVELPELAPASVREVPAEEEEVVFDRTIPEEIEEEPELVHHVPKPAFVAVDDYKRIINDTNTIRSKLMSAENFVRRLGDLKNEEERSLDKWRKHLEGVEKKLAYVDQLIEKANR